MKARLVYTSSAYHLLVCTGAIKKLAPADARRFIETYDSDLHYAGSGKWDFGGLTMDDYGGETVVRVNDDDTLLVESAEQFRQLINYNEDAEIKYLSPAEYAARVGRTRAIVGRLCQAGRIPGVKRAGNRWLIPEDAPYPSDGRKN